jgi:hypothetical protein
LDKTGRNLVLTGRTLQTFAAAAALLALGHPTLAGDVKTKSSEIELGAIPKYADEASAQAGCRPDSVVWADSKTGFYYPKFFAEYGATQHGAYTCYKQAEKADYWSLSPTSDVGFKGREFPLNFCDVCS